MSDPILLRFVKSVEDVSELPPTPAEVTVIGRSNVGKSSLINAMTRRKDLARTSKRPGRTQLLNLFKVDAEGGGSVVDCPGYGYARASARSRLQWMEMIEVYLLHRANLVMAMVLVDGEVGPTSLDLDMLDWLRDNLVPHTVVATKIDKVRSSRVARRRRELAKKCLLEVDDVVWTSVTKNVGIDRLRDLMRLWLGT